ncbi:MAG: sugar ABC transporter permease, partial [Spirochaetota bacterium]
MKLSAKARNDIVGWAFLAPNAIGFLTFTIFPVLFSLAVSFTDWDYTQGIKSLTFNYGRNFLEIWGDKWFVSSLTNTFIFAFTVAPVTIV